MSSPDPVIEILYFAGCPNHVPTVELTRQVVRELGLEVDVHEVAVETVAEAQTHRFIGSPSVRVNGEDIEVDARGRSDFGLSCRMYDTGGVPPKELLTQVLREATR